MSHYIGIFLSVRGVGSRSTNPQQNSIALSLRLGPKTCSL